MSKKKKKTVPSAETKELPLDKLKKQIPKEYQGIASVYLELPQRVAALEEGMNKIINILNKASKAAASKKENNKTGKNITPPTQGVPNIPSWIQPIASAIARSLIGGGGGDFFTNLGREYFLDSFSYDRVMRREMAKSMGKTFVSEWKKERNKLKGLIGEKSEEAA